MNKLINDCTSSEPWDLAASHEKAMVPKVLTGPAFSPTIWKDKGVKKQAVPGG